MVTYGIRRCLQSFVHNPYIVLSTETRTVGDDFIFEISFFIFVWKLCSTFLNCIDLIISSKSFSKLSSLFICTGRCFDLKLKVSFSLSLISLLLVLLVSQLSHRKKNLFHLERFIRFSISLISFNW